MINDVFVSIIIPVYNGEKYIKDTLNSILGQTYKNFEVIVIDDYSSDNTFSILNEYANKDNRIKIFKNDQNMGVSKTRNKAVELAKYNWIAFLDADDLWEKDKLEKQINLLINNQDSKLFYTGSKFIDDDGKLYDFELSIPEKIEYKKLLKQNLISCSSVLVLKDLFLKYKMQSDKMHEDFALWLQILKNDIKYAKGIDEPLLIYRIARNSKSSNKFKSAMMNYRVYKFVGLNFFQRIYYMLIYTLKGLKKYKSIKR